MADSSGKKDALPRLLLFTDRRQCGARGLAYTVQAALEAGAPVVILREKDLSQREQALWAKRLLGLTEAVGAQLRVASNIPLASSLGIGVHLAASDAFPDLDLPHVGRSCHNGAELARAEAEGVDSVTLSPVFASFSKPGYGPVLTLNGLSHLVGMSGLAVYALGGVTPEQTVAVRRAGAYGVGTMGTVMRAPDPGAVVAAYLRELL